MGVAHYGTSIATMAKYRERACHIVSNASRLSSSPSDWEWRDRSDDAFSQLAVFHVPDKPLLHQDAKNRAHTSLPLNLVVRPSQNHPSRMGIWSVDTIPCGVRFGPLIGEIRLANAESALLCPMEASGAGGPPPTPPPTEAPQSWKILTPSGGRIVKTIHVDDDARSNWMKFVNVAVSTETQNLVACQVDKEIYFFSIVQIKPNTELTFWFSREYALRMNYPTSCELARTVQVPKSLKQPWIVQEQRERQREEVRSASPVEALDFSIKKDTTSLNSLKEIHLIEGSRSEKAEQADTAECGENSDSETSPLCSDSDNSSEKSSKSNSCSPPVAEVQQAARANVIQNPVVRPVPTRIPIFADAGPIRPRALDPLAIFQDYFRRTTQQMTKELCKFPAGGLWVPPGTAAAAVAASAASAASRLPASGQPSDVQPVLGATAGAPFAQYGIYGNQEIKPIFNSTSFGAGGLSSHFGGGHGGGGGSFPAPPFPAASGTPAPNDGFGPPKYIQHQENGKTRYACKECHKTFGQLSNLKVHVRTHTGERPFKCTVCGKEFTQLAHLQKHNLVHTGERPHRCEICDKRFSSTSNLKTHLRLHNGQKPYTCDVCNAKFTQYVHLRLHKRLHANERPYSCSTCGKKYISPSGLRTHWKTTTCKPDKDMKLDREDEDDISSTTGHMIKEEEDLDMESLQPSYSGMSSSIHMSQPTSSNSLPPMSSNGHVHSSGHSGLGSSLASLGNPNLNGGLSNGLNGGLSNINGGLSNGLNGLNGNMGGLVGGMNGHGANLQNSLGPNGLCQPNGMGNGFGNGLGSDLNCINNNRLMSNGLNGFMPHGMNNNNNNNIVGSHGLIGSTGVINNGHPHHRQLVGHQGLPPQHSGMGLGNSLPALNDPNNPLHQPLKLPELNSLKNSLFQNNFGYQ